MVEQLYILIDHRYHEPRAICKVIVTDHDDEIAFFKITEVIYDNSGNGIFRYYHKIGKEFVGSLQYIYDIK